MAGKKKVQTKQVKFIPDQKPFGEMAKAFGTARMSKLTGYAGKNGLSTGTAREAEKLYLGVIGYAEKYGNAEQVSRARKLNPAKLRWMYNNGMFKVEEVFAYRENGSVATPFETYEDEDTKESIRGSLNLLFWRYDKLNKEANRLDRERRAAKKKA